MARKTITGLVKQGDTWHIDKTIKGQRICESTGTGEREEAERYLIYRLEQIRKEQVYGIRKTRIWREAAIKYLVDFADQPSISLTATALEWLDPIIGDLSIDHVDDDSLAPFIEYMRTEREITQKDGKKRKIKPASNRTINLYIERVIRILNLCAKKWRDDNKMYWIDKVPSITKLDEKSDARQPYPLSWEEQEIFFSQMPKHLYQMSLFKVNTGTREQEVCKLRWDWEIAVPELGTSVFLVPAQFGGRSETSGVKNSEERLIILNRVAKQVIEEQRLIRNKDLSATGSEFVFPYEGRAIHRMNDSAWDTASKKAGDVWKQRYKTNPNKAFVNLRVHDLKHTFGRRLRAAGVAFEDRQVLLGHTNGSITSHYSAVELDKLIDAANKVTSVGSTSPTLTILKRRA